MAWISLIDEHQATGLLERLYADARKRTGTVAGIIRVMSRDAAIATESMRFYMRLMKSPAALSESRRELLAAVVSCANDCWY